jgi:hypothetical protein
MVTFLCEHASVLPGHVLSTWEDTVTIKHVHSYSSKVPSGIHISLNNRQRVYVSCNPNGLKALASYEVVVLHSTTLDAVQRFPLAQTQTLEVPYHPLAHGCSAETLVSLQGLAVGLQGTEHEPPQ